MGEWKEEYEIKKELREIEDLTKVVGGHVIDMTFMHNLF